MIPGVDLGIHLCVQVGSLFYLECYAGGGESLSEEISPDQLELSLERIPAPAKAFATYEFSESP